jgi:putative spermidine/putrescine transport system substrate-binding protein
MMSGTWGFPRAARGALILAAAALVAAGCGGGNSSSGSAGSGGSGGSAGAGAAGQVPTANLPVLKSIGPGEGTLNLIAWEGYLQPQ